MEVNVVQFFHPGGEHGIDDEKAMVKHWNKGAHQRKFLKAKGRYVVDPKHGILSDVTPLLFRGEWEPDSRVTYVFDNDSDLWPKHQHEPFLKLGRKFKSAKLSCSDMLDEQEKDADEKGYCVAGCDDDACQNTDPFVFSDAFYYSLCKQLKNSKDSEDGEVTTWLSQLAIGSLILFGSKVTDENGENAFALDTVFVVAKSCPYTMETYKENLDDFVPQHYGYIMGFDHILGHSTKLPLTCYKGATPEEPVAGMYSFVPCQTADVEGKSFRRVLIKETDGLSDFINVNNTRGARGVALVSVERALEVWTRVCEIVKTQGCLQGVDFRYEVI